MRIICKHWARNKYSRYVAVIYICCHAVEPVLIAAQRNFGFRLILGTASTASMTWEV